MEWVSRILAVAAEMVLPGVGGGWLDNRWGTAPLFTLLGFAVGVSLAIWHLILMTKTAATGSGSASEEPRDSDEQR